MNTVADEVNVLLRTPKEVMRDCAKRVKALRIEQNISQVVLAERVGVAVGTVKRFEKTGEIQFNHLLKVALVLGRLDDFNALFPVADKPQSLFGLKETKPRQRARRK